ncbi:hypothetical protein KQH87_06280 [Ligilactobacillus animalis]|uniref:hypothetical protein n=1 Tax=Ligilactobacillus animalis TaxID=1605 RepID=UPI001C11B757|nr:hypothetical protein [Ligilactobacillus animalis]MBU5279474.1 hypothetical protein [Ligilactobacillus animalis]
MANMQVIYYLDDGQSYFLRQRDKSLVSDQQAASKWANKKEAQKVLDSLVNKQLPAQTRSVLSQLKVGDLNQVWPKKALNQYTPEEQALIADIVGMDQVEFISMFEKFVRLLGLIPAIRDELSKKISQEDGAITQDFLHTIELGKFNAFEGYKLTKEFQKSRQNRRKLKDRFEILSELVNFNCGIAEITSNTIKDTQNLIESMEKREYTYRSKKLRDTFGYLLER